MLANGDTATCHLQNIESLSRQSFANDQSSRLQALEKARALCARLETPWETMTRMVWIEPSVCVAIKIGIDLDVFNKLDVDGPGKPISELAQATGAEASFLGRILRLLASVFIVIESEADEFLATDFSNMLSSPGYTGGFATVTSDVWPVYTKLPKYFAQSKYQSPHDASHGPFQFGMQTNLHGTQWLQANPEHGRAFNALMGEYHKQQHSRWINVYPPENLVEHFKAATDPCTSPLIVDIGGGIGTDMENLRQSLLPDTYKIIVQDLPQVVAQGRRENSSLTFKEIDVLKQQPVSGACIYFMQSVLHNWPDEEAKLILQNIARAMTPGFSKLLLCENVMPNKGVRPMAGALDIVMMAFLCSQERTEAEWSRLLESAGYRLIKVWRSALTNRAVIEAELDA